MTSVWITMPFPVIQQTRHERLSHDQDDAVATAGSAGEEAKRQGSEYAALSRQIRSAGLLRRRPLAYAVQIGGTFAVFAGACALIVTLGDTWWQMLAAVVLGVAFTQMAFLGHDGGHQQVFTTRRANDLLGQLTGNLLVGLSYGWWIDKHNRHHANPNKEDHDPDIGAGVLTFTAGQAAARTSRLSRMIARRQAWLFFPLLTLEGLNLHVASVRSLLPGARYNLRGGHRRMEALLLGLHLVGYLGGLLLVLSPAKLLVFVAVHQAVFGFYMGCSFAPNHKGMPTIGADETIDYLRRQVLTARNVRGGHVIDWLLGGLNYQIEHHLFPNMPRPRCAMPSHWCALTALNSRSAMPRHRCSAPTVPRSAISTRSGAGPSVHRDPINQPFSVRRTA